MQRIGTDGVSLLPLFSPADLAAAGGPTEPAHRDDDDPMKDARLRRRLSN